MFRIRVLQSQYLWLQQIRQTARVCCGHGGRRVLVQFWAVVIAAEHQSLGLKHCTKPEHPQRCAFRAAFLLGGLLCPHLSHSLFCSRSICVCGRLASQREIVAGQQASESSAVHCGSRALVCSEQVCDVSPQVCWASSSYSSVY